MNTNSQNFNQTSQPNYKEQKKKGGCLKFGLAAVVFIALLWFFFGGGIEQQAEKDLQKIENQVALDAEKQYEIAKKNGSAIDAYTQASLVAAAYLQANDESNYKKWKEIESKEAKAAGLKQ